MGCRLCVAAISKTSPPMSSDAESRSAPMAGARLGARLDALPSAWPACWPFWRLVLLVSLGGFFEFYDLLMTGYI